MVADVTVGQWYHPYCYTAGSRASSLPRHPSRTLLYTDGDKLELSSIQCIHLKLGSSEGYLQYSGYSLVSFKIRADSKTRNVCELCPHTFISVIKLYNLFRLPQATGLCLCHTSLSIHWLHGQLKKESIRNFSFENITYHGSGCSHWTRGPCSTLENQRKRICLVRVR